PVPASHLDPHAAGGEVELVVDGDHVARLDLVEATGSAHRFARKIHEGLRLHQKNPLAFQLRLADEGGELLPVEGGAQLPGHFVEDEETHVVAGRLVLGTGISQTNEEFQDPSSASTAP